MSVEITVYEDTKEIPYHCRACRNFYIVSTSKPPIYYCPVCGTMYANVVIDKFLKEQENED